jgi:hypothetical protein
MKRVIKSAQFGMEPSGHEYADAMSWKINDLRAKYEPFVVKPSGIDMLNPFDTLEVEVDDEDGITQEWYIDHNRSQDIYTLYHNYDYSNIKSRAALYSECKKLGKFDSVDSAMSWLFENVNWSE